MRRKIYKRGDVVNGNKVLKRTECKPPYSGNLYVCECKCGVPYRGTRKVIGEGCEICRMAKDKEKQK